MINYVFNKKRTIRVTLALLIILWCALIFFMSAETATVSSERSGGITEKAIKLLLSIFGLGESEELRGFVEHIVRKCAHVFLYFVLSILSSFFVYTYDVKMIKRLIISFAFCVFYASSDEIHQLFVEGRSGSIKDVMIDSIGIVLGALLVYIVYKIQNKIVTKTPSRFVSA